MFICAVLDVSQLSYLFSPNVFEVLAITAVPSHWLVWLDTRPSSHPANLASSHRISLWVTSSDIERNWYNLSRDAIAVHWLLLCCLHTARIISKQDRPSLIPHKHEDHHETPIESNHHYEISKHTSLSIWWKKKIHLFFSRASTLGQNGRSYHIMSPLILCSYIVRIGQREKKLYLIILLQITVSGESIHYPSRSFTPSLSYLRPPSAFDTVSVQHHFFK